MRPALALVTPPATEPVALAEAKAWQRIDSADDDAQLAALIAAARQAAEEYLRRSLVTQTWKLTLDLPSDRDAWWDGVREGAVGALSGGLPRVIPLPRGPVQSIVTVITYDASSTPDTLEPTSYRLDPAGDRLVLKPSAAWPSNLRPVGGCEITYTAGYAAVPQPIRTGILVHLASLYEQRGLCDDAQRLPPGCLALYGPYRIVAPRA